MCSKQRSCICMHTCQFAIVRSVARQPLLPKQSPPNCMDTQFFENVQPQPLYMFGIQEYKKLLRRLSLSLSLCLALLDGFSLSLSHTLCQTDGRTNNRQTYRHTDAARNCGPQTQSRSPRTSEERRRKSKDNLSQKAICFGLLKSRRG